MSEAPLRWRVAAGAAALVIALVVAAVLIGSTAGDSSGEPSGVQGPSANVAADDATTVTVSSAGARTIPPGFLGISMEFSAVRAYTGPTAAHINPVLVALIRSLSPGQRPMLRIGGDSTDVSWLPGKGVKPPPYVAYPLTASWLATTGALARATDAEMMMGINLAADQPALARAQAKAYARALGRRRLLALEIGNEPNVYAHIKLLPLGHHRFRKARPHGYSYSQFSRQFSALEAATGSAPIAGPALSVGPVPKPGSWVQSMPGFLSHQPRLGIFTMHRYPLRNCYVPPRSPQYPSIPHLLAPYATKTLAASVTRWVGIAHSQHKLIRIDELNSVACRGMAGVSDTFASSLWVTDALFWLAQAGVDGVNLHTLPRSAYELFQFSHRGGHWRGLVQPVFYGLRLFAAAAPPHARILNVARAHTPQTVSVWATRARNGSLRVVLINKSRRSGQDISLALPASTPSTGTVTRLLAPGVDARRGVTWGGRGYGDATTTGRLGAPHTQTLTKQGKRYTLSVPAGSAALVTFGPPSRS